MDNISKSVELFGKGFKCSQAVFAAFSEEFGISEKQALQIGACFGGGMSKAEVCGAYTGANELYGKYCTEMVHSAAEILTAMLEADK